MMKRFNIALLLVLAIFSNCTKDKSDNRLSLPDVSNKSNSSIRMFNFYNGPLDMTINNLPLTAYPQPGTATGQSTQLGLSLFPTGAWESPDNGAAFTVPNSLLDKNGNIHLQLRSRSVSGYGLPQFYRYDTVIANDVLHPRDYYVQGDGSIHALDRDNVAPANGQQFKIRIINLGVGKDRNGIGGAVTLTYADGTTVAPELSNIVQGQASGYVTMDYGSFMFRLYDSKGGTVDITKQYCEPPSFPIYDPCAATPPSQQSIYAQLRTFKPGGVYSIVVTPGLFPVLDCNRYIDAPKLFNCYHVILEQDPGVNNTYARVQAVNAVPGKSLTVTLDGQPVTGSTLDYIGNAPADRSSRPDYTITIQGAHTVEVWDGGTKLASRQLTLFPYDNYCIWAYPTADNKVDLLFEANDMTGTVYTNTHYTSGPDDGTIGARNILRFLYNLRMRFLNLAPDQPYITFQDDMQFFSQKAFSNDTLRFPGAFVNMPLGGQPDRNPGITFVMGPYGLYDAANNQLGQEWASVPKLVRVFASVPGSLPQVPGQLVANVPPLNTGKAFIANPGLYDAGTSPTPESGVYTVALVGNTNAGGGHLVLIKHNN